MLLRYIVILPTILVAFAENQLLKPGWDHEGQPHPGDVFWLTKIKLPGYEGTMRAACVVLEVETVAVEGWKGKQLEPLNTYNVRVARIISHTPTDNEFGIPAKDFFKNGQTLATRTNLDAPLHSYLILPHKTYTILGASSEDMKLYGGKLTTMPEEALDRLVLICGMADGWDRNERQGPVVGGVYWILPQHLGFHDVITVYIPCIVLDQSPQDGDKYYVVRMSNRMSGLPLPLGPAQHLNFISVGDDIEHLKGYSVYPEDYHLVIGNPEFMLKWGTKNDVTKIDYGLAHILMASLNSHLDKQGHMRKSGSGVFLRLYSMVDGWNKGEVPLFGGIYWMLLKPNIRYGLYRPFVVLGCVGENKYLVVEMSNRPSLLGPAFRPLLKDFHVVGKDMGKLKQYNIYPDKHYYVHCDPAIMQKWRMGDVTQLETRYASMLVEYMDSRHGGQHTIYNPHRNGYVLLS